MLPRQIAVLGGGLTGLSAAFHLSYRFPKAQIWLFEKDHRLGGWARTNSVKLPLGPNGEDVSVLLESGPRTLRPNSTAVLELAKNLGLDNDLHTIPKSSLAAKNKYVYVPPGELPGVQGLNIVGPTLASLLMRRFLWPLIKAPVKHLFLKNVKNVEDESVHSLISRIIGEDMARVIGSAIVHGIYAADMRELSAHATLPFMKRVRCVHKVLSDTNSTIEEDVLQRYPNVGNMGDRMQDVAVFSFTRGMETLTSALEAHLQKRSNVQILRSSPVLGLLMQKNHTFELTYLRPQASSSSSLSLAHPTHIVSALPLPVLHDIINQQPPSSPSPSSSNTSSSSTHSDYDTSLPRIPHLQANPASSVDVLNLVFPVPPKDIHPPGFGYLIPRPKAGYPSSIENMGENANPGILGVVFDSCSLSFQDSSGMGMSSEEFYERGTHTKITVMLGGPYPPSIPSSVPSSSSICTSDTSSPSQLPPFIKTILSHLQTQLSRPSPLPSPIYWHLSRNKNCIPLYTVGHLERVRQLREVLDADGWEGRVEIIGAGIGGVSVQDCVLAGRDAGLKWL